MKQFRKIIFWCHLIAGVFAGIVVLVMSVTGVLLTYERQFTRWANTRNYQVTQASESAARLPVATLIAGAREAKPTATAATVTLRRESTAPVEVGFGRDGTVFINPFTGAVFGEGSHRTNEFFDVVTDWHRWLGASGQGARHDVGRAITGACNLAFLFIVASGFYLWFPRRKTWGQFKNVLWFRSGLSSKARDFNWHNVIGIWSAVPLFIVVLSGVVISYTWAGNLVYRVVGETPPAANATPPRPANERPQNTPTAPDNLDALFARAAAHTDDWRSISFRLPNTPDAPAVFTLDAGDGGQPHKRATLTLNRASGEVVKYEPFSNNSRGRQLRSILRFAHTGEAAGFTGQTIAGLVSLGAAFLVWTGLSLSWRRFHTWRSRRGNNVDADGLENAAESGTT
ncbi:MAG: PepSY domain-containing protein [Pyrinomonadaceae bacterium MAG19_C2-C3]|nr:PepSY domain-containing protein [Pyrinomonadaceae bacterium MAG19_C2-C3]